MHGLFIKTFWAILLSTISSADVAACSVHPKPTDEELYSNADRVFVGRIMRTDLREISREECDAEECEIIEGRYRLVESIKGTTRRTGKVVDSIFGPGTCSIGLIAGWYYVFYTGPDNVVAWPGGTYAIGPWLRDKDLEAARNLKLPGHKRPEDEG